MDTRRLKALLASAGLASLLAALAPASAWADITSNLEVRYWFDEAAGTSAVDSTGKHRTATLKNGGIITGTGRFGGGVDLDGVDDVIECPPISNTDNASELTVAFWVYIDNSTDFDVLCSKFEDGQNYFGIQLGGGSPVNNGVDELLIYINNNSMTTTYEYTTGDVLSDDKWIHVAVVYNGGLSGADTCKVYIDGALVTTQTTGTLPTTLHTDTSDPWWIGWRQGLADYALDGKVDDFHLYTRALSATDVA
jgi:hypothetical protein